MCGLRAGGCLKSLGLAGFFCLKEKEKMGQG
jgi:hypothetical protein